MTTAANKLQTKPVFPKMHINIKTVLLGKKLFFESHQNSNICCTNLKAAWKIVITVVHNHQYMNVVKKDQSYSQ